jgi:predicted DNA-binding transcriptional regulator AlpA
MTPKRSEYQGCNGNGAPPKPLVPVDWVAARLGVNRFRAYELMRTGQVPGIVRIGRSIRVDSEAVEAFIREGGAGPDAGR